MNIVVDSVDDMQDLGRKIGGVLIGGEVIELVGDVGAGKTTFTRGLALGLGITEDVQSPTFTISRVYEAHDDLELRHYDFYRLGEAGIMLGELAEAFELPKSIVVVEWSGVVEDVLPADRIRMTITSTSETSRSVVMQAFGPKSKKILDLLR